MQQPTHIGSYELIDKIATGGQAVVWRARDTRTAEEVALKALTSDASGPRFARE